MVCMAAMARRQIRARENEADGETIASAVKHEEEVSCAPLSGTKVANASEDTRNIERERKSHHA